jgi:hypothetical protein
MDYTYYRIEEETMQKIVSFLILFLLLGAGIAQSQSAFEIGDSVLAFWEPNKLYYVGTIVERDSTVKGGAYRIIFADGDQAVVPTAKIRELNITEGSIVLAMWSDKRFYPGTVAKIVGSALFIHFDDGDKGWTSWAGIAIK